MTMKLQELSDLKNRLVGCLGYDDDKKTFSLTYVN